ncbi:MAG TPA: molybdate ABC transporter substrate-binding protein [Rheinheimera sp.]|nr:molybdate ABC transporter substrate-binding protein [Rheinheimera sp.]
MLRHALCLMFTVFCLSLQAADKLTIAAASDLRFALTDIVAQFKQQHTDATVELVFGASGKLSSQIQHGAPFDIYFSADIRYANTLADAGFATTVPAVHALGRLVLWSNKAGISALTLSDLTQKRFKRIAIAQPEHAPYGLRAKQALIKAGLWQQLQAKIVYGENIAQTAQMVKSGSADIGIIALSLALSPALHDKPYTLIDETLHSPLEQGYVVTLHGAANPLSKQFIAYLQSTNARNIMLRYGFTEPQRNHEERYAP